MSLNGHDPLKATQVVSFISKYTYLILFEVLIKDSIFEMQTRAHQNKQFIYFGPCTLFNTTVFLQMSKIKKTTIYKH